MSEWLKGTLTRLGVPGWVLVGAGTIYGIVDFAGNADYASTGLIELIQWGAVSLEAAARAGVLVPGMLVLGFGLILWAGMTSAKKAASPAQPEERPEAVSSPAPANPAFRTPPASPSMSPATIFADIRGRSPYDRGRVVEKYVGQRVEWPVSLHGLDAAPHGRIMVTGEFKDDGSTAIVNWVLVHCNVDLADYPQLKVAPTGARFRMRGTISGISVPLGIDLSDAELLFD